MTALVVPIDLAALCVGKPDTEGDDPGGPAKALAPVADFSALPYVAGGQVHKRGPYTSAAVLAAGPPFGGEVSLLGGIHLHWALPDGLTHGLAGKDEVSFPPVPNRWLITRMLIDSTSTVPPPLKSWVVESDRLSRASTAPQGFQQPTVPMAPTPGQNFRFIGYSVPLESWSEQSDPVERLAPLTAVGYGEATFAALYSNSSTVFGFLDQLDDVKGLDPERTTVSYHVAGWYSDPASDPLSAGTVDPDENPYRWRWQGAEPTSTVCSGVVSGIAWDPNREYLGQATQSLSVSIGPSGPEATSALLAAVLDPDQFPGVEWLLDALQFGLLGRGGQTGTTAALEEAIHAAGFARLPGGSLWTLRPEQIEPSRTGSDVNALNQLQEQLDALRLELQARQEKLFADWYKYLLVVRDPAHVPPDLRPEDAAVQDYLIEDEIAEITAITIPGGKLDQLEEEIALLASSLRAGDKDGAQRKPDLPAPPFFQPADPVVVLAGPDAQPPARYGHDGQGSPDGYLPCRLDDQIVTAVSLAAGLVSGSDELSLPASALPAPDHAPSPLLAALVREALLIAPAAAAGVAAVVAGQGGTANPAVLDFPGTSEALAAAASSFLAGTTPAGVTYTGSAPDPIMVNDWAGTPWLPVRLDYDITFTPVQRVDPEAGRHGYAPAFIGKHFRLAPGAIDLDYVGPRPSKQEHYLGSVILTDAATVDLASEIQRYLDGTDDKDKELADLLAQLSGLPMLTQRLTGALQAMLMRSLTLQLPVADPLASPPEMTFVTQVAAAVGAQTGLAPLPENSFNPIRTGMATIDRLRLVDAFGRFKDYPAPTVAVAASLTPPNQLSAPPGTAFLEPRITQPARLQFRWLSATGDSVLTNDDPATSPIDGWVLPLFLDRTIALYAADGTPLGQLTASPDGTRSLWTPAPGGPFPPQTPIAEALANQNQQLAAFATAAYNGGDGSFLAPFIDAVREALAFSLPATFRESAEAAVLAGQPLALARARLDLELAGPPATDESWTTFYDEVVNGAPPNDAGLGSVMFPVRLGALTKLEDTLVGFWLGEDYGNFYSLSATTSNGPVKPPVQDTLTLTPQGASSTATVALLLDPRGLVHASTGVLPVQAVSIPREHYAGALSALGPTLAVHPFLSGASSGNPAFALPKVSQGRWFWVSAASGAWSVIPAGDASSQATLDYTPQQILEGWLRLEPDGDKQP